MYLIIKTINSYSELIKLWKWARMLNKHKPFPNVTKGELPFKFLEAERFLYLRLRVSKGNI